MKSPRLDTQKWAKRLRDPFWQFAGVVVALIALTVSVFVTYDVIRRTSERPRLEGVITRKYPIINLNEEVLAELEVYYLGQRARVVSSFFFTIENTGESPVRPEDYYPGPPIISTEGSGEIAKIAITNRQPETIDLEVSHISTNTFQLSQALLNPGDKVEFQIILVNEDDPWSEAILKQVSGRIVGTEDIQFRQSDEPTMLTFANRSFAFTFYEFLVLAVIAGVLFYFALRLIGRTSTQHQAQPYREVKTVIMAAMSVITVFWVYLLVPAIISGYPARWWKIWAPPTIIGGFLVMIYALWIVRMLRENTNSQPVEQVLSDFSPSSEQDMSSESNT